MALNPGTKHDLIHPGPAPLPPQLELASIQPALKPTWGKSQYLLDLNMATPHLTTELMPLSFLTFANFAVKL